MERTQALPGSQSKCLLQIVKSIIKSPAYGVVVFPGISGKAEPEYGKQYFHLPRSDLISYKVKKVFFKDFSG
jgi:hypothetical protein